MGKDEYIFFIQSRLRFYCCADSGINSIFKRWGHFSEKGKKKKHLQWKYFCDMLEKLKNHVCRFCGRCLARSLWKHETQTEEKPMEVIT